MKIHASAPYAVDAKLGDPTNSPEFIRDTSCQRFAAFGPVPHQEFNPELRNTVRSQCGISTCFSDSGRAYPFNPKRDFSLGYRHVKIDYRNLVSTVDPKKSITVLEIINVKSNSTRFRRMQVFVKVFEPERLYIPSEDDGSQDMASSDDRTNGFTFTCPLSGAVYGWHVIPLQLFVGLSIEQGMSVWLQARGRVHEQYMVSRIHHILLRYYLL